jgi:hypothetical protein
MNEKPGWAVFILLAFMLLPGTRWRAEQCSRSKCTTRPRSSSKTISPTQAGSCGTKVFIGLSNARSIAAFSA